MNRILNVLYFVVLVTTLIILGNSCTPAQPRSDYRLPWITESNSAKYYVFFEQGNTSDSTLYQLRDGIDWKNGTVGYLIDSVNAPTTEYTIPDVLNDGQYIVFGIVGVGADGLYGAMGVSAPFKKPTVPTKPITLPPVRIKN